MANMRSIRDVLGNCPCRSCINEYFDVYLQPKDCRYYPHQDRCTSCRRKHMNIVSDLTFTGKAKMLPKIA